MAENHSDNVECGLYDNKFINLADLQIYLNKCEFINADPEVTKRTLCLISKDMQKQNVGCHP